LRRSARALSTVCLRSRLSEAISDGVKALGPREVAGFGFGETVKAVTEGLLKPVFECFPMFGSQCGQSVVGQGQFRRIGLPGQAGGDPQHSLIAAFSFCRYNNLMQITFDPAKRNKTLAERGLDFLDAALVFAVVTLEVEDTRKHYSETRIICYGLLAGRMVVVGYTPRGADRIFSA